MNKHLCEHVLNYGSDLLGYLKLRATIFLGRHPSVNIRKSQGRLGLILNQSEISEFGGLDYLKSLGRMGFCELSEEDGFLVIDLGLCDEGVYWFTDPKPKVSKSKIFKEKRCRSGVREFLEYAAKKLGETPDFRSGFGYHPKYLNTAKAILGNMPMEEAKEVIDFVADNKDSIEGVPKDIGLNGVLSKFYWNTFVRLKDNPPDSTVNRFVETDDEDSFSW